MSGKWRGGQEQAPWDGAGIRGSRLESGQMTRGGAGRWDDTRRGQVVGRQASGASGTGLAAGGTGTVGGQMLGSGSQRSSRGRGQVVNGRCWAT